MGRRWITIEIGDRPNPYRAIKCVIGGDDKSGVTKPTGWKVATVLSTGPSLLEKINI